MTPQGRPSSRRWLWAAACHPHATPRLPHPLSPPPPLLPTYPPLAGRDHSLLAQPLPHPPRYPARRPPADLGITHHPWYSRHHISSATHARADPVFAQAVSKRAGRKKDAAAGKGQPTAQFAKKAVFETTKKKEVGVSDLTLISKVSNEAINDNLKKRFENGDIYVRRPACAHPSSGSAVARRSPTATDGSADIYWTRAGVGQSIP